MADIYWNWVCSHPWFQQGQWYSRRSKWYEPDLARKGVLYKDLKNIWYFILFLLSILASQCCLAAFINFNCNSILQFNKVSIFTECLNEIFTDIMSYLNWFKYSLLLTSFFYQALILSERQFQIFPTNALVISYLTHKPIHVTEEHQHC